MFDNLSEKLSTSLNKLRGYGRLTESNIDETLNDVKKALLEADVNFRVVKAFLKTVKNRALGAELQGSLTPGQQFLKIVNDELTALMGGSNESLTSAKNPPTITMMVGLQGSGKTSTVGKLAKLYKSRGHRPFLIPADVYRPAAIEQLKILANTIGVPCYESQSDQDPRDIVKAGIDAAKAAEADFVFVDTAGRLHIDETLMTEITDLKNILDPQEILFVADAMTGQDAVNVAKSFNDQLDITGVVLTKMDGDARGGAALSIRAITQKPIKFVTVGEKLENLEAFHPDRVASRILGMGDLLSLIEKAEQTFSEKDQLQLQEKMRKNTFSLEDFRNQLGMVRKMGSMKDLLGMMPGMSSKMLKDANVDDKQLVHIDAIISSMTPQERENCEVINGSRRARIAKGSGRSVSEINRLIKQFQQMRKMMNKLSKVQDPRKAMRMMQQLMP